MSKNNDDTLPENHEDEGSTREYPTAHAPAQDTADTVPIERFSDSPVDGESRAQRSWHARPVVAVVAGALLLLGGIGIGSVATLAASTGLRTVSDVVADGQKPAPSSHGSATPAAPASPGSANPGAANPGTAAPDCAAAPKAPKAPNKAPSKAAPPTKGSAPAPGKKAGPAHGAPGPAADPRNPGAAPEACAPTK